MPPHEQPLPDMPPAERRKFSAAKLRTMLSRWKLQRRGRTFREAAELMRVTERTLYNWQQGKTMPDANDLLGIVFALQVTLLDISDAA